MRYIQILALKLKMKFDCKDIEIDDGEFGCTLTFSDRKEDPTKEYISVKAAIEALGNYVLLQRTYGEFEGEDDYYYYERSNPEDGGELNDFLIYLIPTKFRLEQNSNHIEAGLNISTEQFNQIHECLKVITHNRGKLIVEQ